MPRLLPRFAILAPLLLPCCAAPAGSAGYLAEAEQALARGDGPAAVLAAEATEARDKAEYDRLIAVAVEKNQVDRDATTKLEQLRRHTRWTLALAYRLAGRHADARDTLLQRFRDGDPDAMWLAIEEFDALGSRAEAEGWLTSRREADGTWSPYLCHYPAALALLAFKYGDAAAARAGLEAAVARTAHPLTEAGLRCLLGDLSLRQNDGNDALDQYRRANAIVTGMSLRGPKAVVELRLAKAQAALGEWERSGESLARLDTRELLAPGQPEEAARLREQATEQTAAIAKARGDLPTPPRGLSLLTALERLQGVTKKAAADGSTQWTGDGPWQITVDQDGDVSAELTRELHVPGHAFVLRAEHDSTLFWNPRVRCFDYGQDRSGPSQWDCRFVLFDNGDLFVGRHSFSGMGVYLSPTREPYAGLCCFGMPRARAWAVTEVLGSYPIVGDEHWLHARLADGSTFEGAAVRDDGGLVPTRYGCFIHPGRGGFAGWFEAGTPRDGAFFHLGDQLDLLWDRSWYLLSEHQGSTIDHGKWNHTGGQAVWWLDPFVWRPGCHFIHWDRRTGIELSIDNSLLFRAVVDHERLAKAERQDEAIRRGAVEQAQRDRERAEELRYREQQRAEELAEYRRTHPNWREEEAAAQRQAERAASSRAFQFMSDERSALCIKCSGAGTLYVPGGASQDYVWSTMGNGSWQWGTVHRSGELVQCHWCQGSGRR